MALILCLFPVALLLVLMTRKNSTPAHRALPVCALLLYLIKLAYFAETPVRVHAAVLTGLLSAWTPILIVAGAVLLFKTMERSGAMDVVRAWLFSLTANPVGQIMLVGWAFSFLIEGASGFGTPAALAAPVLVGMGFPPVRVAVVCLVMNSVPVSFGAVGTPTWFGLGGLGLSQGEILALGFRTAIIHFVAALVVPVVAIRFLVDGKTLRANLVFVYLSILACLLPYVAIAAFNVEFPSLVGGFLGLLITAFLAGKGIGLAPRHNPNRGKKPEMKPLLMALFPLWGTVLLLVLTRIPQLGIQPLLRATEPSWEWTLGTLGQLRISPALVVELRDIFGATGKAAQWKHELLYVPSILPFGLVSLLAFGVLRMNRQSIGAALQETTERMGKPVIALLAALVFVELLMVRSESVPACTQIIGGSFADRLGGQWRLFAPYLGALGSFFSGSNTVSNLTFGGIQYAIAIRTSLDPIVALAMQSAGGAMGNMVCIHNIVAVCSILGIERGEGYILRRTVWLMLLYGGLAVGVGFFL